MLGQFERHNGNSPGFGRSPNVGHAVRMCQQLRVKCQRAARRIAGHRNSRQSFSVSVPIRNQVEAEAAICDDALAESFKPVSRAGQPPEAWYVHVLTRKQGPHKCANPGARVKAMAFLLQRMAFTPRISNGTGAATRYRWLGPPEHPGSTRRSRHAIRIARRNRLCHSSQ